LGVIIDKLTKYLENSGYKIESTSISEITKSAIENILDEEH